MPSANDLPAVNSVKLIYQELTVHRVWDGAGCCVPQVAFTSCVGRGWVLRSTAFSVAAPRACNRLPTELKLLRSTDSFRRDLKTFLFHSVYGHQDTD